MSNRNDVCAFPVPENSWQFGISARDYFAAKAMQGIASSFDGMTLEAIEQSLEITAKISYAMADAMIAEGAK